MTRTRPASRSTALFCDELLARLALGLLHRRALRPLLLLLGGFPLGRQFLLGFHFFDAPGSGGERYRRWRRRRSAVDVLLFRFGSPADADGVVERDRHE
jgi:hypothetical protein